MAPNRVVMHVKPDGDEWHVTIGDLPHLILRSKDTAIAEARVQAVFSRPSRLVVYGPGGTIEDEATYPADDSVDGTSGAEST